jgi:RNA polymerase sigma-70 factor (ECF subfamily)
MSSGSHPARDADSDAVLLQAIAERADRAAFQELFQRFAPRLKAHFLRSGQNQSTAEDLAQDVLLNVWHHAGSYRPELASVSTWIFRIARNRFIDVVRRQRYVALSPDQAEIAGDPPELGLDDALAQQQLNARVGQVLQELSAEQAEVIRGSYFSHESASQIAQRLNIPTGTVKSRLRAAMAHLQKRLFPGAGAEGER